MAAPQFVGAESGTGGGNTVSVSIPSDASVGDRLLLVLCVKSGGPTETPAGWAEVVTTLETPTDGAGYMYVYTATATSGGAIDPGSTYVVQLAANANHTYGCIAYQASDILDWNIDVSKTGSVSSVTTPAASALGDARVVHVYGTISNGNPPVNQPVTWTAHASTTERLDAGGTVATSGSGRQTTLMVADEEMLGGGTSTGRTATPIENTRSASLVVLLGSEVARPTADAGPNQTVALGASGVQLDGTASGGAGGPYGSQWRIINDTTGGASLSATNVEDPTLDMGPNAGVVTLGYKVTDIDNVESEEDTVAVTALDATNTAVPVTDVTVTGWTTQPSGAPSVSSTLGDNSDSTYAEYADPSGTVVLEVGLSGLTAPGSGQPVTVWYRPSIFEATSGSVTVSLKQGSSTVIATWSADTWSTPDSVRLFSHELTSEQVAAITDWNDLRLRFEGTAS